MFTLTNIHGSLHEALLPGGKLRQQLLLSLSGPLTPADAKTEIICIIINWIMKCPFSKAMNDGLESNGSWNVDML